MNGHRPSLLSMSGFSSSEGKIGSMPLRMEIKSLNHRFLDLKIRLPKEFSSIEHLLRSAIKSRFSRGSIDFKMEFITDNADYASSFELNSNLAKLYYKRLSELKKDLKINNDITLNDLLNLPDVIKRAVPENEIDSDPEALWKRLENYVNQAMDRLVAMKCEEGKELFNALDKNCRELKPQIAFLRKRRSEHSDLYKGKISERIGAIFEAHKINDSTVQSVLESRIAQELALLLDRTDIEEELSRFEGHLDHFMKILAEGSPAGRKLDFILQEMNREVNTLSSKAQDFQISDEVVQIKVRVEQLREQVMNVE